MAKTDTPPTDSADVAPADDDEALRRRLLSRIAVAGVVIVGLLGGLAVYDALNKPPAPALPKMAASVEREAPTAAEKAAEEPAAGEKTAAAEKPAEGQAAEEKPAAARTAAAETVPERTETPLAPPPADKPPKAAKALTPPATAQPAAVKPSAPAVAAARPDAAREIARAVPEGSAPATAERKPAAHAPAARPLTQAAAESARRFLLQVGVFGNHANAEELAARLHEAGLPTQIESRVQVGPFATRQEADAARIKLKALGIDDGMLVRR